MTDRAAMRFYLEKAAAIEALARAAEGDLGITLHSCAVELMDKAFQVACDARSPATSETAGGELSS